MANQKKGFVLYFDSLGLLNLFPPDQIGELLLALYDYAHRICETEETPEEALFRYPMLHDTTQVGFISMAGHILRDTRTWKQRQAQCRSSAAKRYQQAALKPPPPPAVNGEGSTRPAPQLRGETPAEHQAADGLRPREAGRGAPASEAIADPEVSRAYMEKIRRALAESARPMEETPTDPERRRARNEEVLRQLKAGIHPMEENSIEEIM